MDYFSHLFISLNNFQKVYLSNPM